MRALVMFGVMAMLASGAAAQPGPGVSVTRGAGADDCPDGAALLARIEQLRGRPDAGAPIAYHVEFTHENGEYTAAIRARSGSSGARVLREQALTCAGLEQATAVTLALLLDSDARALTQRAPGPPGAPGSQPTPPGSSPQPLPARATSGNASQPLASARSDARVARGDGDGDDERDAIEISDPELSGNSRMLRVRSATFALGAAGMLGVLRPIAPALSLELGLRSGRYRAGAGVLWAPGLARELAPGSVREALVSATARACIAPLIGTVLRFDLCSGALLGSLHGEADGFTRNRAASRLWLALPLELALASTPRGAGWELNAAALIPLRRQDFAIDRAGVAYASWPVAVLVSARATGVWEW